MNYDGVYLGEHASRYIFCARFLFFISIECAKFFSHLGMRNIPIFIESVVKSELFQLVAARSTIMFLLFFVLFHLFCLVEPMLKALKQDNIS